MTAAFPRLPSVLLLGNRDISAQSQLLDTTAECHKDVRGREIRAMQLWVYGHAALHELKAAVAQIVAELKRGQHIPRSADRNWLFEDMAPLVDGRSLGCNTCRCSRPASPTPVFH